MSALEAHAIVAAKKRKLEEGDKIDCVLSPLKSFKGFSLEKVLCENAKSKSVFILGKFEGSDDKAVVLLEKTPFSSERVTNYVCQDTNLKETLKNDIYGTYDAYIPVDENAVKATIIYPATEKHIIKYMDQERFVVTETADLYRSITLPYLEEREFSVQWVYNILEKKTESERIVFEDLDPETGFILLPDMKWDRKDINTLYLQAIVHKRGIKSLRDLNRTHLPLLRNILENGSAAIKDKFGVPRSKLNIFIHYQPSYNHLHVHFMHVKSETHGCAHLLTDVIQNIELKDDYYQWKTLTYIIREMDELYKRFKDAGHIRTEHFIMIYPWRTKEEQACSNNKEIDNPIQKSTNATKFWSVYKQCEQGRVYASELGMETAMDLKQPMNVRLSDTDREIEVAIQEYLAKETPMDRLKEMFSKKGIKLNKRTITVTKGKIKNEEKLTYTIKDYSRFPIMCANLIGYCVYDTAAMLDADIEVLVHDEIRYDVLFLQTSAGVLELFPKILHDIARWRDYVFTIYWVDGNSNSEVTDCYTTVPQQIVVELVQKVKRISDKSLKRNFKYHIDFA